MPNRRCLFVLLLPLLTACSIKVDMIRPEAEVQAPTSFSHASFDALLHEYVEEGLVDYKRLKADDALTPYLRALAETDPSNLTEDERFAFWINAYNALTLHLMVENYPTKSILYLTPFGFIIPKVSTPFKAKVGYVGGEVQTLDHIEHGILRQEFDDPRLHFAIVCAALSCPPLRAEAYVAERLDEQLDDQGHGFLHDRSKNALPSDDPNTIHLSKIFDWFGSDFADTDAGLQQYLAQYFEGDVRQKLLEGAYRIKHSHYSWTINDQARADERRPPIPLPPEE